MKSKMKFVPISLAVAMLIIFVWTDDIRIFLFKNTIIAYLFLLFAFSIIVFWLISRRIESPKLKSFEFLWLLTFFSFLFQNMNLLNGTYNNFIQYTIIVLCIPLLSLSDKWIDGMVKIVILLSMVYAIVTIGSLFLKDIYIDIIVPMIPTEYHQEMLSQFTSGRIPGMTSHYSTNGIYLGFGAGIMLIYFYMSNNKFTFLNKMLVIIVFAALLITGKRAQSVFCVSSIILVYYLYKTDKKNGRILKILGVLGAVILGVFIVGQFIPAVMNVFSRMVLQLTEGDFFNGRLAFYKEALKSFSENPIFGAGWRYNWYSMGIEVHNVYIQLLSETGIIGFGIYMSIFIGTFLVTIQSIKLEKKNLNNEKNNEVRNLSISAFIQCFFLQYCATGNPLYDEQALYLYVLACTIVYGYLYRRKGINNYKI